MEVHGQLHLLADFMTALQLHSLAFLIQWLHFNLGRYWFCTENNVTLGEMDLGAHSIPQKGNTQPIQLTREIPMIILGSTSGLVVHSLLVY
jgi:hypothetical protein